MKAYTPSELLLKLKHYEQLPEKARRHFLGLEYQALGHGSQRYLSSIFGCSRNTITKGYRELLHTKVEDIDYSRQRRPGGGRKKRVVAPTDSSTT